PKEGTAGRLAAPGVSVLLHLGRPLVMLLIIPPSAAMFGSMLAVCQTDSGACWPRGSFFGKQKSVASVAV
ncbi:unnamed protein product, partial [Amoebophrya sp. A120]